MKIHEHGNKNEIKISKFQFTCDDVDKTIPKPLPQTLNFFLGLCGKPGSGKSSLILNMLCKRGKMYNRKFDKVYIFSPSLTTMKTNPFESIPEDQVFTELNEDELQGVLDDIEGSGEKVLMVIDDCVNDLQKSASLQRMMCKVIMNRRHLCGEGGSLSIMLTSQVYNKIPCAIRKCFSHLIMLNNKQRREVDSLFEEHILIPKDAFYKVLRHCFKKKFDFMYLDLSKDSDLMFHHNFNQLTLTFPEDEEEEDLEKKK